MLQNQIYRMALSFAIVLGFTAVTAEPVAGQDCADYCYPCLITYHEGEQHNSNGSYDMNCTMAGECQTCLRLELVGEAPASAQIIFDAMEGLTPQEVASVVRKYGDRLLLQASRDLLIVRGTNCDPDVVAGVKFVSRETSAALAGLGVQPFEEYLAELDADQTLVVGER